VTEPPLPPPTTPDPGRGVAPETELDPGRPAPPARTELDPGRTAPPEDDEWGEGRLPRSLASRYRLIRELDGGAEGQLFLVSDRRHGHEWVLKLYNLGLGPDPEVRQVLARLAGEPHLVRFAEPPGVTAGRAYEVMEHLAGGSLDDLLSRSPPPLPAATVHAIVRQVAGALAAMHREGMPHRDIKPGNILLRSQEPLELAIIDFGITRRTDGTVFHPTRSGTPAYMAPEQWSGELSFAIDWWALGMTLLKLCTGTQPYESLEARPQLIQKQVATREVDLSEVADPRLLLLLRGLLTRDPEDRWGAEQIGRWLAGESPPVVAPATAEPQYEPYDLHGVAVTGRIQLATLLAEEWDSSVTRFFSGEGSQPAWQPLREWIDDLDGDTDGRERLLEWLEGPGDPDLKLLRLLRWLDPGQPPIFRAENLTLERVAALAEKAVGETPGTAPSTVARLWELRLLPELSTAPGGRGLAETDTRWRELYDSWIALARELGETFPELRGPVDGIPADLVLPYLLWLAAGERRATRALREAARAAEAALPQPVPWHTRLIRADADPLELLAALLLDGAAQADAAELEAARLHRAWLLREESVHDWYRSQERPIALGWAAVGTCAVAAGWTWMIESSSLLPLASPSVITLGWICALLMIMVVLAAELALATAIGGPYHSRYSLIGALVRQARRLARPITTNGLLGLGLGVCALGLLVFAEFLPPALPLGSTAAHIVWTIVRYRRWTADQADRARDIEQARQEQRAETEGVRV
jgi:hypothetical protein